MVYVLMETIIQEVLQYHRIFRFAHVNSPISKLEQRHTLHTTMYAPTRQPQHHTTLKAVTSKFKQRFCLCRTEHLV